MKEQQSEESRLGWFAIHGSRIAIVSIIVALCAAALSTFSLVQQFQNNVQCQCDDSKLIEHVERHKRSINSQMVQQFIRWGAKSCSGRGATITSATALREGRIVAAHDSRGNIAAGAEMICQSTSNDVSSRSGRGTSSYRMQQVNFDHMALGLSGSRAQGSIHCAFCKITASSVITLLGKTSCGKNATGLAQLYVGVYVTAGASQGICVQNGNAGDAAETTRSEISLGGPIVTGTSGIYRSSNKQLPCAVCANLINLEDFRGPPGRDGRDGQDGQDGRDGRDGATGARGPPGRDFGGSSGLA